MKKLFKPYMFLIISAGAYFGWYFLFAKEFEFNGIIIGMILLQSFATYYEITIAKDVKISMSSSIGLVSFMFWGPAIPIISSIISNISTSVKKFDDIKEILQKFSFNVGQTIISLFVIHKMKYSLSIDVGKQNNCWKILIIILVYHLLNILFVTLVISFNQGKLIKIFSVKAAFLHVVSAIIITIISIYLYYDRGIIGIILFYYVIFQFQKVILLSEKETEVRLLKEHVEEIEKLRNIQNAERHEYNKHIQTLQAMIYLNKVDEAKSYIDEISQGTFDTSKIIVTPNLSLSILLNKKKMIAEDKNIRFDFAIKCDVSKLKILNSDLTSILGNLIDNAFEAVLKIPKNPKVGVEIKFQRGNYVFYVYNNGPKIKKEMQSLIFESGYTTKTGDQSGWGLYLTKKIVEKYKGEVEVVSKNKTTFIVYLPIC
jgi:signal transduction histidine kinase